MNVDQVISGHNQKKYSSNVLDLSLFWSGFCQAENCLVDISDKDTNVVLFIVN